MEWPSGHCKKALDGRAAGHEITLEPPRQMPSAVVFQEGKSVPYRWREQDGDRRGRRRDTQTCFHVVSPKLLGLLAGTVQWYHIARMGKAAPSVGGLTIEHAIVVRYHPPMASGEAVVHRGGTKRRSPIDPV